MERIEFVIEGSSGNEYNVLFEIDNNIAHAYCDCQAGHNGSHCKHRTAIMSGDISTLISDNHADIVRLSRLLEGTSLKSAYQALVEAERKFRIAKNELDVAKKALNRVMYR